MAKHRKKRKLARRPVRRVRRRRHRRAGKSNLLWLIGAGIAAWLIGSRATAEETEGEGQSTPLAPVTVVPEIVGPG
jgi:hypothetical protein